jgi:hypothetical protein
VVLAEGGREGCPDARHTGSRRAGEGGDANELPGATLGNCGDSERDLDGVAIAGPIGPGRGRAGSGEDQAGR